jgi:hypothetical protein
MFLGGTQETSKVKEFVSAVLGKFHGVAKDDYTEHCGHGTRLFLDTMKRDAVLWDAIRTF